MKIAIKFFVIIFIGLVFNKKSFAQIEMQGSQYLFDKTYINPAFLGAEGLLNANLHYQLNNIENGANKSYTISAAANVELKRIKSGLGINVVKNSFGNDNYTMGYINYGYHLPVSDHVTLTSAISLGIQQFDINISNLITVQQNDPYAKRNIYSSKFDSRFGLRVNIKKKYYAGISFDNILSLYTKKDDFSNQVPPTFRKINMYIIGGAKIDYENGLVLEPNLMFIKNFGGTTAIDLNAAINFKNSFGFGIGFRQQVEENKNFGVEGEDKTYNQSLIRPLINYTLNVGSKNLMKFGYCYNFSANQSVGISRNSHDMSIIFNIK